MLGVSEVQRIGIVQVVLFKRLEEPYCASAIAVKICDCRVEILACKRRTDSSVYAKPADTRRQIAQCWILEELWPQLTQTARSRPFPMLDAVGK
jgi:hypothetical protein